MSAQPQVPCGAVEDCLDCNGAGWVQYVCPTCGHLGDEVRCHCNPEDLTGTVPADEGGERG